MYIIIYRERYRDMHGLNRYPVVHGVYPLDIYIYIYIYTHAYLNCVYAYIYYIP